MTAATPQTGSGSVPQAGTHRAVWVVGVYRRKPNGRLGPLVGGDLEFVEAATPHGARCHVAAMHRMAGEDGVFVPVAFPLAALDTLRRIAAAPHSLPRSQE